MEYMRRLWVPGIFNAEADPSLTIRVWLKTTAYYVISVTSSSKFDIQCSSLDEILPLFAATSNKAFSGCFESIASINEVERSPRSVAWLLVKLYYASFFAAHGNMRACGISCINIDALDAIRIFELADIYGALGSVEKIDHGQYCVALDSVKSILSFSKLGTKGSHEAMWFSYKGFLETSLKQLPSIMTIPEQKNTVEKQLKSLINIISFKGNNGGNWLSSFRNSVQYTQSYGAWYPYSLNKSFSFNLISRVEQDFLHGPSESLLPAKGSKSEDEVDTFYRGATFLSSVARQTVLEMSSRSTNRKSVAARGAVTFLRLSKLD